MDYIHKLPFILGAVMTIIVGALSYGYNVNDQVLYMRMALSMVVFYILGLYIRYILKSTIEDIEKRKMEEQLKKEEESSAKDKSEENNSTIDFKVGDDEEFSPLAVSEVIKSKINN